MDEPPKKILITRLSHIGDCLLTLPLVNAIVDLLPTTQISWAVESPTQQLLSLHPSIHEIIKIPKGWLGKPTGWWALRQQLRSRNFDVVIDPQGISKSAGLGWLTNAKTRIGIQGKWGRELSPWLNNRLVETENPHIVPRSIELIKGLGLNPNDIQPRFDLPVCPESSTAMDQWLSSETSRSKMEAGRFIVINPGGTWASKRWEMDRFGELACHLKNEHQITSVVVWAGDEEHEMAASIQRAAEDHGNRDACVVACKTSLRELAALSHKSLFFIGGDTGPLHLANAVGTPCIGLYGTTRPTESGAFGEQNIAIQSWYQSGTCRERRSAPNDAMRDISVDEVKRACDEIVKRQHLSMNVSSDAA